MARPPISSCLKRVRCPVHGLVRPTQRRHASGITPAEVKALIPTMKDSVVWKWDQVTMAMSGGVDSAVALRILSEWVGHVRSAECDQLVHDVSGILTRSRSISTSSSCGTGTRSCPNRQKTRSRRLTPTRPIRRRPKGPTCHRAGGKKIGSRCRGYARMLAYRNIGCDSSISAGSIGRGCSNPPLMSGKREARPTRMWRATGRSNLGRF